MRYSLTLIFIIFVMLGQQVLAHTDGNLTVHQAWIAEAPPNAKVLAAYLEIQNHTTSDAKLIGVSSSLFENVEIHRNEKHDGMSHMVKQDSVIVPANGNIIFKSGDLHLMLMKPKKPVKAGDEIGLALKFADGKKVFATAKVKKRNTADDGHHHDHEHQHEH